MRKLILIRIVHTSADRGSMKQEMKKEKIAKIGRKRWEENQRLIEKFWRDAENHQKPVGSGRQMYGKSWGID